MRSVLENSVSVIRQYRKIGIAAKRDLELLMGVPDESDPGTNPTVMGRRSRQKSINTKERTQRKAGKLMKKGTPP
jgi:hypothetical protein